MAATRVSARRARKQKRSAGSERRKPPQGGALHGILLGLLLWAIVLFLYYAGGAVRQTDLVEGQRARNTLVASVGFSYPDLALTELLKQQAADSVPPVFAIDLVDYNTALRTLSRLYEKLERLQSDAATTNQSDQAVAEALYLLGIPLTPDEARAISPPGHEKEILTAVKAGLKDVWNRGIVSDRERATAFDAFAARNEISVLTGLDTLRTPVVLNDLLLPDQAARLAAQIITRDVEDITLPETVFAKMLKPMLTPNLRYDAAYTDARREEARKQIEPVEATTPAGSTIVEAGERITPQIMGAILAHEQRTAEMESAKDRFLDRIGHGALLFITLIIALGFMRILTPAAVADGKIVALFALLSLAVIFPAKVLLYASATSRLFPATLMAPLLPIGLAPLLGSILIGGPAAAVIGLWTTLCVSIFYGHSFPILILGLVVTVVAAGSAGEVRKRWRVFRMGLFIGLAAVAVVLCFGALNQLTAHTLGIQVVNALLSGLLASLLAVILIPVFEWLFDLTTDITLLELSDMGHPVLQRLAMEAPGTYHHSLMVANLAASAASSIGANSLLARVSAYFHDIGKLTKPEFFAENIQFAQNPHDDLSPSMSALVIISHVKEGLALAQRHNLPKPILDGIEQHHGTSLIFYFYHRALKQSESDPDSSAVTEEDFRYPGPKPRNREMGILLLADSVEAASRSMEKPTAAKITALVDDIVDSRLRDGQLDHCNLTFAHLADIKESFVFTLTNMLHGRVAYPKHEDRDKQPTRPPAHQSGEAEALQPVAHGSD